VPLVHSTFAEVPSFSLFTMPPTATVCTLRTSVCWQHAMMNRLLSGCHPRIRGGSSLSRCQATSEPCSLLTTCKGGLALWSCIFASLILDPNDFLQVLRRRFGGGGGAIVHFTSAWAPSFPLFTKLPQPLVPLFPLWCADSKR